MTREEYSRTLRYMEYLRLSSYETETKAEARRLKREYSALMRAIQPFIDGTKAFDDETLIRSERG